MEVTFSVSENIILGFSPTTTLQSEKNFPTRGKEAVLKKKEVVDKLKIR